MACWTSRKIDKRWVRIRRPTIVVGGELTMDNLEVTLNTSTGISEAPMQLKSNCGTLVIDDFGRQRMSTDELLNRWIVPLEKRYDFLNMANGKKIQVPFDQLIIFSTNLEPRDLVDDAFLRRIPYKIEVVDPSEEEFRELFRMMCPIRWDSTTTTRPSIYLIETHYKAVGRPFRCCQPRDLLLQVRNYCRYQKAILVLTREAPRLRRGELLRGDVGHRGAFQEPPAGRLSVPGFGLLVTLGAEVERQLRVFLLGVRDSAPGTAGSAGCRDCAGTCRCRTRGSRRRSRDRRSGRWARPG